MVLLAALDDRSILLPVSIAQSAPTNLYDTPILNAGSIVIKPRSSSVWMSAHSSRPLLARLISAPRYWWISGHSRRLAHSRQR